MSKFSRTWWGERFIEALEQFTDSARLKRGRSYAKGGKVLNYKHSPGEITATVRGSVNPYFGVYKEPRYKVSIAITPISAKQWSKVIQEIASKASFVSKLLMNEVPDRIEEVFAKTGLHLLPHSSKDFKTDCSCPDIANPCKHIAGVYYLVASELDHNPFLLFELRGLSKEALRKELSNTPLGTALSQQLETAEIEPKSAESYFTRPMKQKAENVTLKEFWTGLKRLPKAIETASPPIVHAIVVKKQGDFPPFWDRDNSFVEAMELLYNEVRTRNKSIGL
jgi:uncharacterized Zn finger protein